MCHRRSLSIGECQSLKRIDHPQAIKLKVSDIARNKNEIVLQRSRGNHRIADRWRPAAQNAFAKQTPPRFCRLKVELDDTPSKPWIDNAIHPRHQPDALNNVLRRTRAASQLANRDNREIEFGKARTADADLGSCDASRRSRKYREDTSCKRNLSATVLDAVKDVHVLVFKDGPVFMKFLEHRKS